MIDDVVSVMPCPVNEAGVAAMLEVLPYDVQPRCRSDTSLLADRAVGCQNWNMQPGMMWAVAGGDDHGPDMFRGQVEPCHRLRAVEPTGSDGRQDLAAEAGLIDVSVDGVEEAVHSLIGFSNLGAKIRSE
jgi:hypothetical protein